MENYSDTEIQIDILHKIDFFSSDSEKLSFMHDLSVFENDDTRETRKVFEPEIQFDFYKDIDHKPDAKNDENLKDGDNKANKFEMNIYLNYIKMFLKILNLTKKIMSYHFKIVPLLFFMGHLWITIIPIIIKRF